MSRLYNTCLQVWKLPWFFVQLWLFPALVILKYKFYYLILILFFNIYQEILRKIFEGNSQPWAQCCIKIRKGEDGQEWENLSMGNVWWPPKEKLSVGSECQIAIDSRVSGKVRTSCIVPINGLCLTSQSWNPHCPWETALLLAAL